MLNWSENKQPDEECKYNYCTANTPFGRFLLTWKVGEEDPGYGFETTPWNRVEYHGWDSLEAAKKWAEEEMDRRLAAFFIVENPVRPRQCFIVTVTVEESELESELSAMNHSVESSVVFDSMPSKVDIVNAFTKKYMYYTDHIGVKLVTLRACKLLPEVPIINSCSSWNKVPFSGVRVRMHTEDYFEIGDKNRES
jgi:hypothetical protein